MIPDSLPGWKRTVVFTLLFIQRTVNLFSTGMAVYWTCGSYGKKGFFAVAFELSGCCGYNFNVFGLEPSWMLNA